MPSKKNKKTTTPSTPANHRPAATINRDERVLAFISEHGPSTMRELLEHLELDYSQYALAYNAVRRLQAAGLLVKTRDGSRTPLWATPEQSGSDATPA